MSKSLLFAVYLLCAAVGPATAGYLSVAVPTSEIDNFTYQGRSLESFIVGLDSELLAFECTGASLEIRFEAASNWPGRHVEVQVARWLNGMPVLPEGKERPIAARLHREGPATFQVDLMPIIEPLFEAGQTTSLRLVLGSVSADALGAVETLPVDPASSTWVRLDIDYR